MKKHLNKVVILLSIFLIFTILCSHVYVVIEADHNCIGENCSICQTIEKIENNVKKFIPKVSTFIIVSACFLEAALLFIINNVYFAKSSPVKLRDKITN